jgi:hypothetical protein
MSNEEIRPTSIVGIKRLAKSLKAESRIPHHQALNLAARRAGFENFRHAGKKLPTPPSARTAPGHRLYITGVWKDRDTGARGGETTWVDLSAPWADLVTRVQMQAQRSLVRLIPEAEDHLTYQYMFGSQSEARRATCAAVRTFQFMDATKLRPTRAHSRVYPGGSSSNAIPGRDHSGSWYDPVSKGYVFADEPYEPRALEHAAARAAWAAQHNYEIAKPDWPGMYNPGGEGGSRLYLVADRRKGRSVADLAAALNRLPPPMVEENWAGNSAQGMERFRSPAELRRVNAPAPLAMVEPKTPRQKSARGPQDSRPGRMPIEVHEEVGRKLKAVMADTFRRSGVYNRIDTVRCKLDDWIQREYDPKELPMERFSEVYYGSAPKTTFARSLAPAQVAQHVAALEEVKELLQQYYPESQLKWVFGKLDAAAKSGQTWT